jgi:hypothetical protein
MQDDKEQDLRDRLRLIQEVDIQNVLGRKGVGWSEPKVERWLQRLFTFRYKRFNRK